MVAGCLFCLIFPIFFCLRHFGVAYFVLFLFFFFLSSAFWCGSGRVVVAFLVCRRRNETQSATLAKTPSLTLVPPGPRKTANNRTK